ncbi:MAG: DUF309 domain-containing protein [Bacillota bacterium]|nr:DUF309 domain-containing protein [Bacillota bacterium]MDP4169210.1 DUF309 domain-containing protein [Bacillota bacterium]
MYPKEYIDYLIQFHAERDYFECHEILEEYWKKEDPSNKNSIWVALILLAVSAYHHRRGNFSGAMRTLLKAKAIFLRNQSQVQILGLDTLQLFTLLDDRCSQIKQNNDFTNFPLPISDAQLLELCNYECKKRELTWNNGSSTTEHDIIHRHITRDRTSVIKEREQAKMDKKKKGNE